jgi:hypothetical protein
MPSILKGISIGSWHLRCDGVSASGIWRGGVDLEWAASTPRYQSSSFLLLNVFPKAFSLGPKAILMLLRGSTVSPRKKRESKPHPETGPFRAHLSLGWDRAYANILVFMPVLLFPQGAIEPA